MLKIHDLNLSFENGQSSAHILKDFNLTVTAGEIVALVGESGAGKSTVGAAIGGRLPPGGKIMSGSITFNGERLDSFSPTQFERIRGAEIGSIFQNPLSALNPFETAGRQLIETLIIRGGVARRSARERAITLLRRVGFDDPEIILPRYPHELSGGMLQRVVVAIALSCDPSLIIADEPTTALDVSLRNGIIELLRDAAEASQIGVLLITHDVSVVQAAAHRVCILHKGEVIETGATSDVLANPRHPYARRLISSVPPPTGKLKRLQNPPLSTLQPNSLRLDRNDSRAATGVVLQDVSVRYAGKRNIFLKQTTDLYALKNVNLSAAPGRILGIVGSSGSGKTTVARLIAGLADPTAGRITFTHAVEDKSGGSANAPTVDEAVASPTDAPLVQMIFQNPFASLNPRYSVFRQLIDAPKKVAGMSRADAEDQAVTLIEAVGLARNDLDKYPHAFSGGQLQRISIARALSMNPSLLICDEPTSALDVTIQAYIVDMLKDLNDAFGVTIVFITHDLSVCRHLCDDVVVLNRGEVCETGSTLDVLDAPKHRFTQRLVLNSNVCQRIDDRKAQAIKGAGSPNAGGTDDGELLSRIQSA